MLYPSPKLQTEIRYMILNFRFHLIVFTADICKMYRHILIIPEHSTYLALLPERTDERLRTSNHNIRFNVFPVLGNFNFTSIGQIWEGKVSCRFKDAVREFFMLMTWRLGQMQGQSNARYNYFVLYITYSIKILWVLLPDGRGTLSFSWASPVSPKHVANSTQITKIIEKNTSFTILLLW